MKARTLIFSLAVGFFATSLLANQEETSEASDSTALEIHLPESITEVRFPEPYTDLEEFLKNLVTSYGIHLCPECYPDEERESEVYDN